MEFLIRPAKAVGAMVGAQMAARAVRRAGRRALAGVGLRRASSPLPAVGLAALSTLLGAGAALSLAPSSGSELRRNLRERLSRAKLLPRPRQVIP